MTVRRYRYHPMPTVEAMQVPESDDYQGWGELAGFLAPTLSTHQWWEVAGPHGRLDPDAWPSTEITGLNWMHGDGVVRLHPPGDWIVRHAGDRYEMMHPAQFRAHFDQEPVIE